MTIDIQTLGGSCPIQAEGFIDDQPFYFRARGSQWSMEIGGDVPLGTPQWSYEEPYGTGLFDAGRMSTD